MGVPAFFRWLSSKYPSIVVNCVEEKSQYDGDTPVPVDNTAPNPNGVEFDNLYLDMNGIIHPCCHPEDKPAPKNEDEMMIAIFEYIDRLFSIIRPRRLLYMAIDGVAPRAKMNQQRSRRFRASQESAEAAESIRLRREEMKSMNIPLPPEKDEKERFDSNCITPGTPFMDRLAKCLRYYIHTKLMTDEAWQKIVVILSDASVPGEGEHKIMDYIRKQRASPAHDPNTHHVLCGADADLIMLGLATHEPNFTIIREEFVPNRPRPCEICGKYGHVADDCHGLTVDDDEDFVCSAAQRETTFIFIRLSVLREYLQRDLQMHNLPFAYDFERVLDDWVFMCFFVGNDFLPHLPSLEIREGAINRLVKLYKDCLYKTGGYLTSNGFLNLARVQLIVAELGAVEDQIFQHRRQDEIDRARRTAARQMRGNRRHGGYNGPNRNLGGQFQPMMPSQHRAPMSNVREAAYEARRENLNNSRGNSQYASGQNSPVDLRGKRVHEEAVVVDDAAVSDEVRLWEHGWKDRYFLSKFRVGPEDLAFRRRVANHYIEGLCWVLRYYYQGCASWSWFFPFHYAPFASDLVNIGNLKIDFPNDTKPIRPLEQLMSVFPPASGKHLPESWAQLMMDPKSHIVDFYPDDFRIDLNGKKFLWQGVALLPFVDKTRLDETLQTVYGKLSDDEVRRNQLGHDLLFVPTKHTLAEFLTTVYESNADSDSWITMDASLCSGISLDVGPDAFVSTFGKTCPSPLPQLQDIEETQALSVRCRDPTFSVGYVFSCKRLPGAKDPTPTLKPGDWDNRVDGNYRPVIGFNRSQVRAQLNQASSRVLHHQMDHVQLHANYYMQQQQRQQYMPPPVYGGDRQLPYHRPMEQPPFYQQQRMYHQYRYESINEDNRRASYEMRQQMHRRGEYQSSGGHGDDRRNRSWNGGSNRPLPRRDQHDRRSFQDDRRRYR